MEIKNRQQAPLSKQRTRIYLITGFLGAGKTTLLKNIVPLLKGEKLHIIINDFGKENIDEALLYDLGVELSPIHRGSIFCNCRIDQFIESLQQALCNEPDSIIIETSGLSDPSSMGKILKREEFIQKVELVGTICLVDALNFKKVYSTALSVQKQLAVSDIILINKTDLIPREDLCQLEIRLNELCPEAKIYDTTYSKIEWEWISDIQSPLAWSITQFVHPPDITLKSHLLEMDGFSTKKEVLEFVQEVSKEAYRIKGFVEVEGKVYLVSAIMEDSQLIPYDGMVDILNKLIILSGKGLHLTKGINRAFEKRNLEKTI